MINASQGLRVLLWLVHVPLVKTSPFALLLTCVSGVIFVFRHDNQVGRWLTSFRATWDPKFEKYAVVGSMRRPRQVNITINIVWKLKFAVHHISFIDEILLLVNEIQCVRRLPKPLLWMLMLRQVKTYNQPSLDNLLWSSFRQIDIFSSELKSNALMHLTHENLNSVNSLNVLHPSVNMLAGGNSSGKVYLWT